MSHRAREAELLWRAMVYLCVAQLHLRGNPTLSRPLRAEDIKPHPAGHWGTVPGTAWALVHIALAAGHQHAPHREHQLVPVIGSGHAGIVQLAWAWLTGDLAALRPQFSRDETGLTRLIASFPKVDGLGAEIHPMLPGGSYVGGCLGGALAFAQGAAAASPDRLLVPVLGDGECETPTTTAAWIAQRELPGGAVLPIVHLNGFRMGNRSLLSAMEDRDLRAYAAGVGWAADIFDVGEGGLDQQAAFAALLDSSIDAAADGDRRIVFLRCVKGWSGPPTVAGRTMLGTPAMHKTPLPAPRQNAEQRRLLEDWLATYRPAQLLEADGTPTQVLRAVIGAARLETLQPHRQTEERNRPWPRTRHKSFTDAVESVLRLHLCRGLRVFSPDELASNRLAAIAGKDWVTEVLAEEVLLGWLAGWTATGRPGVLVSYEAFASLFTAGLIAHLKQRRLARRQDWPSLNLLLTSYGWHNVYTHADPSLATALLATADPAVRVLTPADPDRLALALDEALHSAGRVNLIIAGKHTTATYPDQTLEDERSRGLAIWPHLSDPREPDLTILTAGDLPAAVAAEAVPQLRECHPGVRVRVVNVNELTVLGDPRTWPAGLTSEETNTYLGEHAALLVLTLGHPAATWGLLAHQLGTTARPVAVIGWREPTGPMPQHLIAKYSGLDTAGVIGAAGRLLARQAVVP